MFFSGRKGFHIELRPGAVSQHLLEYVPLHPRFKKWRRLDVELIQHVHVVMGLADNRTNILDHHDTALDREHSAKRINESINAWRTSGDIHYRRMLEVPPVRLISEGPGTLIPKLVRESQTGRQDT